VATSTITVGAGGVTGVNANFNNNAVNYTFNSADAVGITGAYGVTLNGSGTVTFKGANTYTGDTVLNAGTLVVGASSSIGSSANVVLNGGVLDTSAVGGWTLGGSQTLRGTGPIRGSVTAASGATINPGGSANAGTITITNNLTLNGQAMAFDLNFGPTGGDLIAVGNTLSVNSTCTLSLNYLFGTLAGGTYTLMTFPAKAGAGTFVLDTTYPGVTLNVNPTSVTLTVGGGGGTSSAFTNLVGGTWSAPTNWAGNIIATNVDGIADFSTLDIATARTVTINGVKTIGHLIFGDTVQNANWSLTTGTNILAVSSGSPNIIVNNGQSTTISASLQGNQGFTKLGGGALALSGGNFLTGGIRIKSSAVTGSTAGSFGNNTLATANPITLSNAMLTISTALANNAWTNNLILQGTSNNITAGAATPGFRGSAGGSSVLSGSGILTFNCGANTPALAGHMDGFSGTIIVNASGLAGLLMGHNQDSGFYPGADGITGSATTAFEFNGGGVNYMYNGGMPSTNYLGELRGNGAAVLWAKNGRSGDVTLEIGGLGTSSTFAGVMRDNRMGATPYTPINIRKVGAGTLTLSGANLNTGPTDVRGGTLLVSGSLGVTPVTVQNGTTFQLDGSVSSPTITVNNGGRFVVGGAAGLGTAAITLNGVMDTTASAGTFSLGTASLSGSGVVTGSVTLASTVLNPGVIGGAGTLTLGNGDFTASGGILQFDLSGTPGSGNDLLDVNGNIDFNTPGVTVSINKIDGLLGGGTYVLAKCSGTLGGSAANLNLVGAGPMDTLQIIGNQLQLVVTAPLNLTWSGDGGANLWDVGVSTTWLNGVTPTTFANGNSTTFNNTGIANPNVAVAAAVNPSTVVVAGSASYTFAGAGDIGDGASLLKSGTGTLTILNTNTFIGDVFLSGGTLAIGNAGTNGSLAANITNSGALVFNTPLSQVASNAVRGPGPFTKLGAGDLTLTANSTMTGPTIISAGSLTLGDGVSPTGALGTGNVTNNATLAINHAEPFSMSNLIRNNGGVANRATGPVTLSGIISGTGTLTNEPTAGVLNLAAANTYAGGTYIYGGLVMLQNFGGFGVGNVILDDAGGGEIHLAAPTGATNVLANNIRLPAAAQQQFEMDGAALNTRTTVRLTGVISGGLADTPTIFVDSGITLNNRAVVVLENAANIFTTTPEVFRGTLAFTSDGALGAAANDIRVNAANNSGAPFDQAAQGLRFDANNITLNANREIHLVGIENIDVQGFNGTIAGPLTGVGIRKLGPGTLTLTGGGYISGNGSTVAAGTLMVNSTLAAQITVAANGTIGGTGTLEGFATVQSGGKLWPGASIGTLTVTNTLTLNSGSATTMEINAGTLACDKVIGMGTLNYGGTLTVTNLGGSFAIGQSFPLFSADNYNGNFTTVNLPTLGISGAHWNWNAANGTLSVVPDTATNPTNITAVVTGGNLDLSWPPDHLGWRLEVQTNSLSVGIANNWSTWPNSTNVTAVSVPINPANPSVFFRLVYP
jgi:autotransporter-associated beta strand protein